MNFPVRSTKFHSDTQVFTSKSHTLVLALHTLKGMKMEVFVQRENITVPNFNCVKVHNNKLWQSEANKTKTVVCLIQLFLQLQFANRLHFKKIITIYYLKTQGIDKNVDSPGSADITNRIAGISETSVIAHFLRHSEFYLRLNRKRDYCQFRLEENT